MVKTMLKSSLREIRQSLGRYLAILAIVGLGVGFFAGLRMSQPSMMATGIDYLEEYRLYDFRLLSTLGFTEEDLACFAGFEGVEAARGSVYTEFLWQTEEDDEVVLIAHCLTEGVNDPELAAGRMPEAPNECLGDARYFTEDDLGRELPVSPDNDKDTLELLACEEYTLVGLAYSPYYLNFERGTSSIGSGSIAAYLLIPESGFDFDAYYEIFLKLADTETAYSDKYEEQIDALKPELEKLTEERAGLRYTELYEDAMAEIQDGEQELSDGWDEYHAERADAEQELDDAHQELLDGEQEYADGLADYEQGRKDYADGLKKYQDGVDDVADAERELEDGWAEYEKAKADAEKELEDARLELEDGEKAYEEGLQEWEDGRKEIEAGKKEVEESGRELSAAGSQLDSARAELEAGKAQLDGTKLQLDTLKAQLDTLGQQLDQMPPETPEYGKLSAQYQAGMAQYEAGMAQYGAGMAQYEQGLSEYEQGLSQYQSGAAQLSSAREELRSAEKELDEAKEELEQARKELDNGWNEYETAKADAQRELDDARQELLDGEKELEDARAELEDARRELEDAKRELDQAPGDLADARKELDDGWAEYNDGVAEAQEEFADAERELSDGEQELTDAYGKLDDLKEADTYVLTREENTGYVCFDNDTDIVAAISVVFPVFFFLVAALVCMTTMTRMVDEQRTQIGVLKAMGYSNGQIMGKYLFYSGSAATIGSFIGYALGSHGLPWVIWEIYGIMYGFAELQFVFDPVLASISFGAALLCSMGATYLACRMELAKPAAELIRPKTPKAGRRVFLEYITPIWTRLSFLHKVSVRNVLRYRSRLIMMILGIGGCTALLVTGFGLRDSISSVVDDQFEQITLYDYSVTFQEALRQTDAAEYLASRGWEEDQGLLVHSGSIDLVSDGGVKSIYMVISSTDSLDGFISLHSGETTIPYPGEGEAVLNVGLAQKFGISPGDTIQLRDETLGTMTVTVSAVCDNFVFNYVYISPETYERQLGQEPEYKTVFVLAHEEADPYAESVGLSGGEGVSNVSVNVATRDRVDSTLSRMDYIVVVVVLCAAALAFIVLYNLTNINITERIREIATIKVLGFYQKEVASYVFREIIMLSALGSLTGLLMGKALHAFVMAQIQVDGMFFPCQVAPLSYGFSFALTILFTLLITCFMRPRLRKVDMAESLKSIE